MSIKEDWILFIEGLQNLICGSIEAADGKAVFIEDQWKRAEGGGGKTRVISNGNVFEKGGVNTSIVFGEVSQAMKTQLKIDGAKWFACGLSLVLHPVNPFVPTVHCNYRMFELYNEKDEVIDRWFGGGTDLTPYYLSQEDAIHFHGVYKNVCDEFDPGFYPAFKKDCDNYFVNAHRNNERRGIGGIFYDYQRAGGNKDVNFWVNFGEACGNAFIPSYVPLVEKSKNVVFNDSQKHWQEIRRGRYIEFNLIHDRGTLFGLKTNGRTESILMSLPPTARFEYNYQPLPGSEEDKLWQACLHPVDWI
ncbi:MAG TPA: oxygen-dependent coproporphyrinogen oxidase [Hanamia sp.]|nr:oxygen-dependent coproporphyrinogen oxidase [Hanamia sp.]